MNSVHEPGSRTMSKNRLRNNTESNRIENRPSASSAQPVASPRVCRLRLPKAPAARPALLLPPAPHACCRLPRSPSRVLSAPKRHVATQLPVLRHRQPCLLPLHLTIQFLYCDTNSLQPSLLQYKFCNTIPAKSASSCNTINCIAIQFLSQLHPSCNTILP